MPTNRLMLLDGHSLMYRAYYGLMGRQALTAPDGTPTGAVFAFLNMLLKWLQALEPTHVVVAFDRPEPTYRHQRFEGYKATRKPTPRDLAVQIPLIKALLADWGLACLEEAGYEADDLIGTLARLGAPEMPVTIVSGDKDTFQLVTDQVTVLQPVTRSGQSDLEHYDPQAIQDRYGVQPAQLIDVKALMGDPSDNIPGVRGIGEKTALALIGQYGSLEALYEALDQLRPAVAQKLNDQKEDAFLSRDLVTIQTQAPLSSDLSRYRVKPMKRDDLASRMTRLGLKTLLARLDLETVQTTTHWAVQAASLADLQADLKDKRRIALCLTWPGPLVWVDRDKQVRVLDESLSQAAWPLLAQPGLAFWVNGYKAWRRASDLAVALADVHDVGIGAYLLDPTERTSDLARLYQQATGHALPQALASADQDLQQASFLDDEAPQAPHAALAIEAQALAAIGPAQQEALEARGLLAFARQVEFPLSDLLARMEHRGFLLDRQVLEAQSADMTRRLQTLQEAIYSHSDQPFNINSPKQLSDVLFVQLQLPPGKKRSGGSFATDAEELERLHQAHPIVPLITQYRQTAKLLATFVDGLIKAIDPEDGRVHTTFNQTLTATGRLSSSDPNLQNIPIRTAEGRQIREAFVAAPGHLLIDADYSQIELRLLAHLSQDPAMLEAFTHKRDIHTDTAARLFNCPAEDVTADQRAVAKTMNFSIIYGISDFGLARDLGVSLARAHTLIEEYERMYPKVRATLKQFVTQAYETGYVETLTGRRRTLHELKSAQYAVRQFGERAAMNTPLQGTAADLIKKAMVEIDQTLQAKGLKARLILQVHDELILEAPEDEVDQAAQLLKQAMEAAMTLSVPLIADVSVGKSWATSA